MFCFSQADKNGFLFLFLFFNFLSAEALQLVISECKPKAKTVDICEKGDSYIRE